MSSKFLFKNRDARKEFINRMDQKWERKYEQYMHRLPADEGFKYFEYMDE